MGKLEIVFMVIRNSIFEFPTDFPSCIYITCIYILSVLPVCIVVTPGTLLLQESARATTFTLYVRLQSSVGREQSVWLVLQEAVRFPD